MLKNKFGQMISGATSQNFNYLGRTGVNMFDDVLRKHLPNHIYKLHTFKHGGGNIHAWSCISYQRVDDIFRLERKLTAEKYRVILEQHAVSSGHGLIGNNFLQQDNDPKYTSRLMKNCLKVSCKKTEWFALWSGCHNLHRKNNKMAPKNLSQLWNILREEWYRIPDDFIRKLHDSL